MPQHRFLFEKAGEDEQGQHIIHDGEETYKPTKDAEALVDYLLSLKSANYPLPEAPINQPYTSSMPKPAAAPAETVDATKADDAGK